MLREELARIVAPCGQALVAMPLRGSFAEIAAALRQCAVGQYVLAFSYGLSGLAATRGYGKTSRTPSASACCGSRNAFVVSSCSCALTSVEKSIARVYRLARRPPRRRSTNPSEDRPTVDLRFDRMRPRLSSGFTEDRGAVSVTTARGWKKKLGQGRWHTTAVSGPGSSCVRDLRDLPDGTRVAVARRHDRTRDPGPRRRARPQCGLRRADGGGRRARRVERSSRARPFDQQRRCDERLGRPLRSSRLLLAKRRRVVLERSRVCRGHLLSPQRGVVHGELTRAVCPPLWQA